MLELLVQKCITSANPDFLRSGDIFRRVIECIASGLFLPGILSIGVHSFTHQHVLYFYRWTRIEGSLRERRC